MNCQVENCSNKATHTRTEVFEFIHRNIKEKVQSIQLCKMKTLLCQEHKESISAAQTTRVSLDTI